MDLFRKCYPIVNAPESSTRLRLFERLDVVRFHQSRKRDDMVSLNLSPLPRELAREVISNENGFAPFSELFTISNLAIDRRYSTLPTRVVLSFFRGTDFYSGFIRSGFSQI